MRRIDAATPALVVDKTAFDHNVAIMRAERPGARLRPHVKAFKSTAMARHLTDAGHHAFCCATLRELEGMVDAGLDDDLLLANESLDVERLQRIAQRARFTVAVDSPATIEAAATAGVAAVLIDVYVGLPRCGCHRRDAGALAERARASGLEVRGVMGYEGHLMDWTDRARQREEVERSMGFLAEAHASVGGLTSAGGTGTYDFHPDTDEVQAGSYVMMDSHYAQVGLPFRQAAFVVATVISTHEAGEHSWYVADAGLKAFAMDHGNPSLTPFTAGGEVFIMSDEHVTVVAPEADLPAVGDQIWLVPGHIDPTVAKHDQYVVVRSVDDPVVIDRWPIDLRGW